MADPRSLSHGIYLKSHVSRTDTVAPTIVETKPTELPKSECQGFIPVFQCTLNTIRLSSATMNENPVIQFN